MPERSGCHTPVWTAATCMHLVIQLHHAFDMQHCAPHQTGLELNNDVLMLHTACSSCPSNVLRVYTLCTAVWHACRQNLYAICPFGVTGPYVTCLKASNNGVYSWSELKGGTACPGDASELQLQLQNE
jgi:hypothetical protein